MEENKKTVIKDSEGKDRYKIDLATFTSKISNRQMAQEFCQNNSKYRKLNVDLYFPDFPCFTSDYLFEVMKGHKKVKYYSN